MIVEKDWLDEELRKETPAADMPLALPAPLDEEADEEAEAVEILNIERLFHFDLGYSPLLKREEEHVLTQKTREAWQTILHCCEGHHDLIAVFLGEKEIKYDSLGERDILRLLDSLRERVNKPGQGNTGEPPTEELYTVLNRVQEELLCFRVYRDELIRRNLPLVLSVARRYHGQGLGYLDLIQEGVLGLMRAIEKFDPDKGVKFITYAVWWVWQAKVRQCSRNTGTSSGRMPMRPMPVSTLRCTATRLPAFRAARASASAMSSVQFTLMPLGLAVLRETKFVTHD